MRIVLTLIAFVVRLLYGFYKDVDFVHPNDTAAGYLVWTVILCALVYFAAVPRPRSEKHHPSQRASDRRQNNQDQRGINRG